MSDYWKDVSVVVTGGARGQGAAEALHLAQLGATVVAVDIHEEDSPHWHDLRTRAGDNESRVVTLVADVSAPAGWERIADTVTERGLPLNGLINNAGVTLRKTIQETSFAEWERVIGVNLAGAYLGIHHLAPMIREGGAIVNISSTAGLSGYFGAAYSASKWALRGLTRAAAIELADRSIRVNCICPGLTETDMMNAPNAVHDVQGARVFHDANLAATPLGRGAQPEEIARAATFLLGPDASFVTGADLPVDGGFSGGGLYWRIGKLTDNL
ncbi:SDR family NAD(P)-dependent oxidoreductase [Microbacterium sp. C23T]